MRTAPFAGLAATLLLAACGQSQPDQPKQSIVVRSEEQDQMHRLNDLDRAIALKRAIYASGYSCKRVERSGYVTEVKNLSMWTAHCSDKVDWAVFIGPDATVQVRHCEDLAQAGFPACVIKPGAAKPA